MLYGSRTANLPSRFISDVAGELSSHRRDDYGDFANEFGPSRSQEVNTFKIPTESFEIGDKVWHGVFGQGRLVAVDGEIVTIEFAGKGKKKLNLGFAPIKKIED